MIATLSGPLVAETTPAHAPRPTFRAADRDGRVWRHHDPIRLYRWLAARDALLGTVEAAVALARRPAPGA